MDPLLLGMAAAFGLAASAGLNTTLPLLLVGVLARAGLLTLAPPFDALSSDVALGGLLLLSVLEFVSDKVPGWDSVVQTIQLPLAATAGAILFASQTSAISSVSPGLAILVGLLTAGGIHAVRTAVRPFVTGGTLGMGNPVVSTAEDGLAVVLATTSVVAPALALVLVVALLVAVYAMGRSLARRGVGIWRRVAART
jgi:Domain of unknown function (DUF4126)